MACGAEISDQQRRVQRRFRSEALWWDSVYESPDLWGRFYQHRRAMVLEMVMQLSLPHDACVLEVGCGTGLTTVELARLGYNVEAVDLVKEMLDLARQHANEANVSDRVLPSTGDVCNLQFGENIFDLVLMIGVLPWLHSPRRAIRELARVAKPRGYLIITSANYWRLDRILDPIQNPVLSPMRVLAKRVLGPIGVLSRNRRSIGQEPAVCMYSTRGLKAIVTSEGLEHVKLVTVGFGPFSLFGKRILSDSSGVRVQERLQRLADRDVPIVRATGQDCILLARKTLSE